MRDANSNFEILKLGLPEFFWSRIASGGSNPARLGKLGGNLLPLFPKNRQKGVVLNIHQPPGYVFQLFWVEKIVPSSKSKPRYFWTLPRCFRERIREGFPSFFTVLHSFFVRSSFVLRSSMGKFSNPRLSIHFLFFRLSSLFRSFSVFFSSVFNALLSFI